jgi:acetyl-CoA acyltransferase
MKLNRVFIPYGAYWSSPFIRWQGKFAHLHPMWFAAEISSIALREREIAPETFDTLFLGMTIPAEHSFYGAPWLTGLIGATTISGPTIDQACATSARVVGSAAYEVETDTDRCILTITCDKSSNGPHLYYPNPSGSGGKGESEDWVWDNFNFDPFAINAMIETAENVICELHITWEEQNALTLLRFQQYKKGGTVSFGSQTHPADGNGGWVLTSRKRALEGA